MGACKISWLQFKLSSSYCLFILLGSTEEDFIHLSFNIGIKLLLKAILAIENDCDPQICQPVKSPTKRARQIKPEEYQGIVEWKNWELERTWHLLRGTQNL